MYCWIEYSCYRHKLVILCNSTWYSVVLIRTQLVPCSSLGSSTEALLDIFKGNSTMHVSHIFMVDQFMTSHFVRPVVCSDEDQQVHAKHVEEK